MFIYMQQNVHMNLLWENVLWDSYLLDDSNPNGEINNCYTRKSIRYRCIEKTLQIFIVKIFERDRMNCNNSSWVPIQQQRIIPTDRVWRAFDSHVKLAPLHAASVRYLSAVKSREEEEDVTRMLRAWNFSTSNKVIRINRAVVAEPRLRTAHFPRVSTTTRVQICSDNSASRLYPRIRSISSHTGDIKFPPVSLLLLLPCLLLVAARWRAMYPS